MTLRALLALAALTSLAVPCATATAQLESSSASRDALLAADHAAAGSSAKSLVSGLPSAFTEDIVVLYPAKPIVRGKENVVALLAALPGAARQTMTWRAVRADVSADGARGFTYGYAERTVPDTAKNDRNATSMMTAPAKYLAFWRNSAAGWRIAAWVFIGGAAAPASSMSAPRGCESAAPITGITHGNEAAERAALMRADSIFSSISATQGAAPAFAAYIADDGASIGGAPEIACGRSKVRAQFGDMGPGVLVWHPVIAESAPSGDLGFTVGVATYGTGADMSHTKYLTIWKKQHDGSWRFVADGGNGAPPNAWTSP